MRVVAGKAGGLKLIAPEGGDVRPTSDRVREAMFNSLYSMDLIEGRAMLDLFAGTGALGIEALSRGASHVTFVEQSTSAIAALEQNLATTGLAAHATIRRGDALTFLARGDHFDVALVDPPYAFDDWALVLDGLQCDHAVVESNRTIEPGERWRVEREKKYGATVVTMLSSQSTNGA